MQSDDSRLKKFESGAMLSEQTFDTRTLPLEKPLFEYKDGSSPWNERRSIEPGRLHTRLANPTGSIIQAPIQAPKVDQSFTLKIYNSEKDFYGIILEYLWNNN